MITGLSGAGKSQAAKLFEDLGFYCVDNLPPELLDGFLHLRDTDQPRYRNVALVLDIRAGDPAPAIERARAALAGGEIPLHVLYLEADRGEPRVALQRDAPPPSAPGARRGAGRHPGRAAPAGADARPCRRDRRHERLLDRSAEGAALRARPVGGGGRRAADRHHHVRVQVRRPARRGPGVRCPLPDESLLGAGSQTALRPHAPGTRVRPRPAGGGALPRPGDRAARADDARLPRRGKVPPHPGARLHRRLPPLDRAGGGAGAASRESPATGRWRSSTGSWSDEAAPPALALPGHAPQALAAARLPRDRDPRPRRRRVPARSLSRPAARRGAVLLLPHRRLARSAGARRHPRRPRAGAHRPRRVGAHAQCRVTVRPARQQRDGGPLHEALPRARAADRRDRRRDRPLDPAPRPQGVQREHHRRRGGGGRRRDPPAASASSSGSCRPATSGTASQPLPTPSRS